MGERMPDPIRLQFKIDSFQNWEILNGYDLLFPDAPEAAIPDKGEYGIVVGNNDLQIYCGLDPEIKWFQSFNLFDGEKSSLNQILIYANDGSTENILEDADTLIWNESEKKFESTVSSIILKIPSNKKGILNWNSSENKWEVNEDYRIVPTDEIDSGIYNTSLQAPSFAGQSLSFGSSNV